MSSPRTDSADRPDDPAEKKEKSQLSAVQVAAGALASVSAAVVASFFGVAGTLIGAALASVISTVSAALYTNSLSRTNEQLRRVRSQLVVVAPRSRTGERPAAAGAPADGTRVLPATLDPRRAPAPRHGRRWPRMAGYAVAVFGLAMAIVTGIEVVGQQPVSALVGAQEASSATTLGELTGGPTSRQDSPPTPTTTPAPSTGSEAPASDTPAPSTQDEDGDGTGTTAPTTSEPSPAESSSAPSSSAPRSTSAGPQTPQGDAGSAGSPDAAGGTAGSVTP